MAGLFFSGDKSYLLFGIATMMVVGIAMIGSLTVLPAMLSKLGDRVEKGRIPFLHRLRRSSGENRFWKKVLTPALRHPVSPRAASAALLAPMALPVFTSTRPSPVSPRCRATLRRSRRSTASRPRSRTARPAPSLRSRANTDPRADFRTPTTRSAAKALETRQMHGPDRARGQQGTHGRAGRRSRSPATASTPSRTRRSRRCATTSFPRRSASSPAPSTPSPAEPRHRPTGTRC